MRAVPPPPWPTPGPVEAAHHLPSLKILAVVVVVLIVAAALTARRRPRPVVMARPPVSPGLRRARRALAVIVAGTGAPLLPSQLAVVALIVLAVLWRLAGKLR